MSYSLIINTSNNTVSIPVSKSLAGYTLKLVLDRGGSSAPLDITSGITTNAGIVTVTFAPSDLSKYAGSDYKLVGTKNGNTDTLESGRIYAPTVAASSSASTVTIANPVSTVTVANPVTTVTVANPVNTVTVSNPVNTVAVSGVAGTVSVVPPTTGTLVKTVQSKVREDFPNAAVDTNFWDVTTGSGMTVAVTASELRIDSGTTANAVTTLRSKQSWSGAYRVMFLSAAVMLSQRIANHEVQLRVTNAAGTSYAGWVFNGTTATTALVRGYNNTTTSGDITQGAIPTTAGLGVFEIENFIDEVYFHTRAPESTNARSTSNVKNRQTPDPNEDMFIEIKVINGATAPASSTRLSLDAVLVQDISELTTEITGGRGGGGASQAVPVTVTAGNLSVTNNPVLSLVGLDTTVSTVAQLANATLTGTTLDGGTTTGTRVNRARVVYTATAATIGSIAHLVLQESLDGTTWRETWRTPVPADNMYHTFELPIRMRYRRYVLANGTVAQTGLLIQERAVLLDGPIDINRVLTIPLTPTAGQAATASAVVLGPTLDLGANHSWNLIRGWAASDQAGNLQIQQSVDNSAWYAMGSGAANVAVGGAIFEQQIACRYVRLAYTNGATAATGLKFNATLVSL